MTAELQLQQRVADELAFDPTVNGAHIGISVRGGVVTLSGHVESYAEKRAAERVVLRVKGVTAVAQELEVRLPEDKKILDDEIAQRAIRILAWDVLVPECAITVKVEHGVVTLEGLVDMGYQRKEAEADIRRLSGVKGVINLLNVRPRPRADDVRASVLGAFERNAELEAKRITVDALGAKIVLGGSVSHWAEKQEAERAAWSVPGVTAVENHIAIIAGP